MPDKEKPKLLLDQIPELHRMRQMAERLGTAMAGNLPGESHRSTVPKAKKPQTGPTSPERSPLEHAVALLNLESGDTG